jgi:hypothetical protein
MRKGFRCTAVLAVMTAIGITAGATTAVVHADAPPVTSLCAIGIGGCNIGGGVQGSGNLVYHSGHVEAGSTNYLIFLDLGEAPGPASVGPCIGVCCIDPGCPSVTAFPPTYGGLIGRFFHDVGGTGFYGLLTQYNVLNESSLGGSYWDTTSYAAVTTLYDADLRNEVKHVESVMGWSGGIGNNFFIFTGPDVTVCNSDGCSGTRFCGYHGTMSDVAGRETAYQVIPYPENQYNSCTVGYSPNLDPAADDAINIASHELFESVTDPGIGVSDYGWYDAAGDEIGDKCAWNFGTVSATGSNITLNGDQYIVQKEYSNHISNCAL